MVIDGFSIIDPDDNVDVVHVTITTSEHGRVTLNQDAIRKIISISVTIISVARC